MVETYGSKHLQRMMFLAARKLISEGIRSFTSRFFMENGAELVLFQPAKPLERGDFEDGTFPSILELPKDVTTVVADLKKSGVKIMYEEHVRESQGDRFIF